MTQRPPDAIVRLRIHPAKQGGRTVKLVDGHFQWPVYVGDERAEANDCRFDVADGRRELAPGDLLERVPVRFLVPELVRGRLAPGTRLTLRLHDDFAVAEVIEGAPA